MGKKNGYWCVVEWPNGGPCGLRFTAAQVSARKGKPDMPVALTDRDGTNVSE